MAEDGYARFYADRLWGLLPGVVRASDAAPGSAEPGPLAELVERIGGAMARSRRGIDALERNAFVETADDWAIPYLADLLATRLVASMDARGQRLDVARTIHYRRRTGTLGLIELLARDVTGWDARAVEFFRRLGRTRHQFDPPIGRNRARAVTAGLRGGWSGTPAGGTADLRTRWVAEASRTAFDEFAHTLDVRRPRQSTGHHAIPRIGVFLWEQPAYPIRGATPVRRAGCPSEFSFDPTGRDVPLRAPGARTRETLGGHWTSPQPWELPLAIGEGLWRAFPDRFYPDALSVLLAGGGTPAPAPLATLAITPEQGRFRFPGGAPVGELLVDYHHGFTGPVGAQGQPDLAAATADDPASRVTVSGGLWGSALASPVDERLVLFDDSRTYAGPAGPIAIDAGGTLILRAVSQRRPLLRWTSPGTLTIDGGTGARLVLRGIAWQGADLVLTGNFASVDIERTTLDPGTASAAGLAQAIDGMALRPASIRVEGSVARLRLDRAICGPIATAGDGLIERLEITDSIVQSLSGDAIATSAGEVQVIRSTILGPCTVHRISASGAIFDDRVMVADPQDGCIRFTSFAAGSMLHAPYRSVAIPRRSAIFVSRRFGDPGFARLRPDADRAIAPPGPGRSISAGGEDGSETGAFASERIALKRRGLRLKLEEFMPIGTTAVPIAAD